MEKSFHASQCVRGKPKPIKGTLGTTSPSVSKLAVSRATQKPGRTRLPTSPLFPSNDACQAEGIVDSIVAVEMTGVYHKPILRRFRKAGYDTRTIHPFASAHYRETLHPDNKTDDTGSIG